MMGKFRRFIFEIVTLGIVFALGYFAAKNNWFDIIIETDIFQSIIEFFRETFNIIK